MTETVLTVILNYRTAEMTLRAAQAAFRAMEGVAGAITIVDNDSQDGSFDWLCTQTADWPRVQVLQAGQNGGFGAGNNAGIRAGLPDGGRPDFIYLLNSDAFPDPDAIATLRDYLLAHRDCGFAGGHLRAEDGTDHVSVFRFPTIWSEFEGAAHTRFISRALARYIVPQGVPTEITRIDWCAGASVMFPRRVLDEVGLFDEGFFLYFEETDLCLRIHQAGYHGVYLPHARAVHITAASTGVKGLARKPEYWFDSRALYFRKRGGQIHFWLATLAHLTGGLIWELRRRVQRKDDRIAPYFLRDLLAHSLRNLRPENNRAQSMAKAQAAPDAR
ncbi:MAG: glycosyltransferase family 2 protein [Rhodobacteraceae bacterium]|nr:MAG: glycosyltransferase family 2 protein [Paracoccaceae bacterium]